MSRQRLDNCTSHLTGLKAQHIQTASGLFEIIKGSIGQAPSDPLAAFENRPFSLNWSHYVFLLGIKKADERNFYEIEAASQNWTLRELKRQFDSGLYERLALSRDKDGFASLQERGKPRANPLSPCSFPYAH